METNRDKEACYLTSGRIPGSVLPIVNLFAVGKVCRMSQ